MTSMMSMADQYEALSKLLQPPNAKDSQSGRERSQTATYERPSVTDLALDQSGQILVAQPSGRAHPIEPSVGIWEDEEVPHQAAACSSEDARETPSFEFLYKQAVTSTDAFLGMMDKDASSACCEDLELRIDLPNVKGLSELDLDVQPLKILLTSPAYLLCLPLPHKIDETRSSAKWVAKKKQLTLTMQIVRDL